MFPFEALPTELKLKILMELPPLSLQNCRAASASMKRLVDGGILGNPSAVRSRRARFFRDLQSVGLVAADAIARGSRKDLRAALACRELDVNVPRRVGVRIGIAKVFFSLVGFACSSSGDAEALRAILALRRGEADVNRVGYVAFGHDNRGTVFFRPLHVAVVDQRPEILNVLLERNDIDVNGGDCFGRSALQLAVDVKEWGAAMRLLEDKRTEVRDVDPSRVAHEFHRARCMGMETKRWGL